MKLLSNLSIEECYQELYLSIVDNSIHGLALTGGILNNPWAEPFVFGSVSESDFSFKLKRAGHLPFRIKNYRANQYFKGRLIPTEEGTLIQINPPKSIDIEATAKDRLLGFGVIFLIAAIPFYLIAKWSGVIALLLFLPIFVYLDHIQVQQVRISWYFVINHLQNTLEAQEINAGTHKK